MFFPSLPSLSQPSRPNIAKEPWRTNRLSLKENDPWSKHNIHTINTHNTHISGSTIANCKSSTENAFFPFTSISVHSMRVNVCAFRYIHFTGSDLFLILQWSYFMYFAYIHTITHKPTHIHLHSQCTHTHTQMLLVSCFSVS